MTCLVGAQDEIGIPGKINDKNLFWPIFNRYIM